MTSFRIEWKTKRSFRARSSLWSMSSEINFDSAPPMFPLSSATIAQFEACKPRISLAVHLAERNQQTRSERKRSRTVITYDICVERTILGSRRDKLLIMTNEKTENKKQQQERDRQPDRGRKGKEEKKSSASLRSFFVVLSLETYLPSGFTSLDYSQFPLIHE